MQICMNNFFNIIGFPKIIRCCGFGEYKNGIIKNLLTLNNLKQIFLSPIDIHREMELWKLSNKEVRKNILNNIDLI